MTEMKNKLVLWSPDQRTPTCTRTVAISHVKWLKQTGPGLQAFLMIAASTQNMLFRHMNNIFDGSGHHLLSYFTCSNALYEYMVTCRSILPVLYQELVISYCLKRLGTGSE